MRFAQVHAEKAPFTVQALCDALDVSTSGYYAWAKRRPSRTNRRANRTRQVDAVRQAFHRSRGRYGSRRVHAELRARGHRISRRSVEELMRDQGLVARPRRRFNLPFAPSPDTASARTLEALPLARITLLAAQRCL